MRLPETLMKTAGILQFGVGTILALHAEKYLLAGEPKGRYLVFASLVLFLTGAVFFVLPPVEDWLSRREARERQGPAKT